MADTTSGPKTPPTPPPDLNYYYIKPILNIPNLGLVLIIIAFFCYIIIQWNYTSINWENEKCNGSNFFLAPIYGKTSTDTLQQCTTNIINKSVMDSMGKMNIGSQITDLSNNVTNVLNELSNANKNGSLEASATINSAGGILSGIQQNIDNIKTALTKVLGSVVLSSYMSQGIIQSTKTLQNSNLVNMVTQYSETNKNLVKELGLIPP